MFLKQTYLASLLCLTVIPVMKDVGCYVNADNDHAFLFGAENKLTCIFGYEAFTQALVSMPNQLEGWLVDILFYRVL